MCFVYMQLVTNYEGNKKCKSQVHRNCVLDYLNVINLHNYHYYLL